MAHAIIESHHKLVPKLFMVPSLSQSFHSFQGRFAEVSWTFAHSGYLKSHQSIIGPSALGVFQRGYSFFQLISGVFMLFCAYSYSDWPLH